MDEKNHVIGRWKMGEKGKKIAEKSIRLPVFTEYFSQKEKNPENRYEKKISILILRNRVPLGFAKFGILEPIRELNMANR